MRKSLAQSTLNMKIIWQRINLNGFSETEITESHRVGCIFRKTTLYYNIIFINPDICHKELQKQQYSPRKTEIHRKNKVILILNRIT